MWRIFGDASKSYVQIDLNHMPFEYHLHGYLNDNVTTYLGRLDTKCMVHMQCHWVIVDSAHIYLKSNLTQLYLGNHTLFHLLCKPPFRKWLNCKYHT
jgi:hypothetical protein